VRLAIPIAALLAAVASREACGGGRDAHDPCAGKACGDFCTLCPPGDPDCAETAIVKACDSAGRCTSEYPVACAPADACAGKACGDECTISLPCHFENPPCLAPVDFGHCDIAGACVPGEFGSCSPHPDCLGKSCGDACNPCGPDHVCPTFVASACDRFGRCVGDVPWICYDPCAGKSCADECWLCPPDAPECAETAVVKACDATGTCVPRTPDLVCPAG